MTKEEQRSKIRAELINDLKYPDYYYPISKKNRDKLNTNSQKRRKSNASTH